MGLDVFKKCTDIEFAMGFDDEDYQIYLDQVPEDARTPKRLNRLLSSIADVECSCSSMLNAQKSLESQLEKLPDSYCPSVCAELREQLVYSRESLAAISIITQRSKDIVQAMVQTIRFIYQGRQIIRLTITGIRKSPTERYDDDS